MQDFEEQLDWVSYLDEDRKAKEWLEEVIHQVYYKGNPRELDHALEELCSIMDVEFPKSDPVMKISSNGYFEMCKDICTGLQNYHITSHGIRE